MRRMLPLSLHRTSFKYFLAVFDFEID
uniref:DUF772 domain-containing protein n=1 Tax=Heterorhabditis bacteriophora TaxID=37862 RepID=A0A1I7WZR6_HETBA